MTNLRKSIIAVVVVVMVLIGWVAIGLMYTLSHLPEAYAAWDTGTLLVEYMKVHDNKWPSSWDDLLTVLESDTEKKIMIRGPRTNNLEYARSLHKTVRVDWSFDPANPVTESPVTRPNGQPLAALWEDPNQMIRDQMRDKSKQ